MEHDYPSSVAYHPDICLITELVKNKFYFATLLPGKREPKATSDIYFFSIDDELIYNNFYNDFGPLNLACLYKYCWKVNHIFNNPRHYQRHIIHYTTDDEEKKTNAAFLVASYAILYLKMSPKQAYRLLITGNNQRQFKNFQDASMGRSPYTIGLQDCLNALYTAATFGLFNFEDFDVSEYEKYQQLKHGDLNWVIPQKFIAFIGPTADPGTPYHAPEHYIDYFMKNRVKTVVRLNRESYDPSRFTNHGISHYELFLPDGSIPSRKILHKFLRLAETTDGPLAIHCKAGLGRTGTLIAAYLIKHYKMTAKEAIAWTRICRPGSVIGHQQSWLEDIQDELWMSGEQHKLRNFGNSRTLIHHHRGIYSIANKTEKKMQTASANCQFPERSQPRPSNHERRENKSGKKLDSSDISRNTSTNPGPSKSGFVRIFGKLKALGGHVSPTKTDSNVLDSSPVPPVKRKQLVTTTGVKRRNGKNSKLTQGDFLNKIKVGRAN
uniref:protein-tyrosine-phosphatase n=1 Tax=Fopius arisanus TaxID=64838 RepID=A0A0C9R841_9HYME